MNTLLMLQYLTLTLFAVNVALGLARAGSVARPSQAPEGDPLSGTIE